MSIYTLLALVVFIIGLSILPEVYGNNYIVVVTAYILCLIILVGLIYFILKGEYNAY